MSSHTQQPHGKSSPESSHLLNIEPAGRQVPDATTHSSHPWSIALLITTVLVFIPITRFITQGCQPTSSTFTMVKLEQRTPASVEVQQGGSRSSGTDPSPLACPFGSLPGKLNMSKPTGEKWQTLSKACPLKNYAGSYLNANSSVAPMSIMFLSDSMDYRIMEAYCKATGGEVTSKGEGQQNFQSHHHRFNLCSNKQGAELQLHQVYLPTMTPVEQVVLPDSQGDRPHLLGYKQKMNLARGNWSEMYPAKEPDMVVMGGGLWDNFRWTTAPLDSLEPIEQTVRANKTISYELLSWWVERAGEAMCYARHVFPNSTLVWRTFAMPNWDRVTGDAAHTTLGNKQMMAEIRAAGIQAARNKGIEIVHVEPLVDSVPDPGMYLSDAHHPREEYLLEVLNIMLNIFFREDGTNEAAIRKQQEELCGA